MDSLKPETLKNNKVAIRVLFLRADYKELKRIAAMERTDVSSLVRRAVAKHFLIPANGNNNNNHG